MNKVYHTDQSKFIVYNQHKSNQKTKLCVIFLHGLLSNMNGSKALFIEDYCKKQNYNFIRFDNFGHGESTGNFIDETIGSWLVGLELVIKTLELTEVILVGSSMGGWVSLLAAQKYPDIIKGVIGLATAADFTYESIWKKLPPAKQLVMQQQGWLEISGENCGEKYPISYNLIKESEKHLLLSAPEINIICPVHLIHGLKDSDVSYEISLLLNEKITSERLVVKLIKDGEHRLSRSQDLNLIVNSLTEVIEAINKVQ